MTTIIDAKNMCDDRIVNYKKEVLKIQNIINKKPEFIIINASNDESNSRYISGKIKEGETVGLKVNVIKFEENCVDEDILEVINKCNIKKIPVILQLPIFDHLNTEKLMKSISYQVDADGFSKEWIGEVNLGNDTLIAPATPKGVIELLEYNNVEIAGKVVLVIGKSNHVGKPLCSMLINRDATLISANKETTDLSTLVKLSDIIISCVGKLNLIDEKDVKKDAVVIGVGFTYVNGKQVLDFDIDKIVELGNAKLVSNRINCTGKATINSLIDNVIKLYKNNFDIR